MVVKIVVKQGQTVSGRDPWVLMRTGVILGVFLQRSRALSTSRVVIYASELAQCSGNHQYSTPAAAVPSVICRSFPEAHATLLRLGLRPAAKVVSQQLHAADSEGLFSTSLPAATSAQTTGELQASGLELQVKSTRTEL